MKKVVSEWTDGDSGTFSDGIRFRLSNVSAPEKHEPGHRLATIRSERLVKQYDLVDIKVVGRDEFRRVLVEMKKRGRDINHILEMKNVLFAVKS